jgi:2-polyprenyl-3-methyl-5-hydroxy-6-metoxy-1,4-benzoquinol methylase
MSTATREIEMHQVACPLCGSAAHRPERTIDDYALVRCGCNFTYVNPQPTDAALDRIYSDRDEAKLIAFYDTTRTTSMIEGYAAILKSIERAAGRKGTLLDFGCGACFFLQQAQEAGWDAHGVDLGPWVEVAARQRGVKNVTVGRLEDSPLAERQFDVVTAMEVMEHMPQPQPILRMLRERLKPGGILFLTVPNYKCLSIVLGRDDFWRNRPPQHLNYFTPKTLSRVLKDCGFKIRSVTSGGGLKLECVLGRKYAGVNEPSVPSESAAKQAQAVAANGTGHGVAPKKALWKRAMLPVVEEILYRRARVGMSLYAIAQRDG